MMKQIFVLAFCLFTTPLYAQENPNTLLWKVTKPGSEHESFIFGTFHEVSPSFFQSLTTVVNELGNADVLFVERSFTLLEEDTLSKFPTWDIGKWESILTTEQEEVFSKYVQKAEDSSYYALNPFALALQGARLYLPNFCEEDFSGEIMDVGIERMAIEQGKKVCSLDGNQGAIISEISENADFAQDSLFASIGIYYMEKMLTDDLTGCELLDIYKGFTLDYLFDENLVRETSLRSSLIDRNDSWVHILDKVMPSQDCFVAVGYQHLLYKQGLIQQLRSLGYEVTPIPIERSL